MMAIQIANEFTQYSLTNEEQLAGQLLTTCNLQVIQNLVSELAIQRLNLIYDPTTPIQFAQQEAHISGQLQILRYLQECSSLAAQQHLDSTDSNNEANPDSHPQIF